MPCKRSKFCSHPPVNPTKKDTRLFHTGLATGPGSLHQAREERQRDPAWGTAVMLQEIVCSPYFQGNKSNGVSQGLGRHIAWIPTPKGVLFFKSLYGS